MNRRNWLIGRKWAILPIFVLAGCQSMFGPHGLPKDPLFIQQNPVEGKATGAAPMRLAALEPAPPPLPVEMTNRPAYARRSATELPDPDRVQLIGFREADTNCATSPRPPRQAPGILTNRPLPRDVTLPDVQAP